VIAQEVKIVQNSMSSKKRRIECLSESSEHVEKLRKSSNEDSVWSSSIGSTAEAEPLEANVATWASLFACSASNVCLAAWKNLRSIIQLEACKQIGANVETMMGRTVDEMISTPFRSVIHPLDIESITTQIEYLQHQTCIRVKPFRIKISDKDLLTASHFKWFALTLNRNGKNETIYALFEDVDEHKRQADRLDLILEGTQLGMWDWNLLTNSVSFNEIYANMVGCKLAEIGQTFDSWSSRVHPDDRATCQADITKHLSGETEYYENVHRMKVNRRV
jgi:PAS domain-containing protein